MGLNNWKAGGQDANSVLKPGITSTRVLYAIVVVDFIANPSALTEEEKTALKEGARRVGNTMYVDRMPRNSIIGKVVSDGAGRSGRAMIFYPLFPPSLSLPIKAGEMAWVIFENAGDKNALGYWLCRRASDLSVDDLNYTHHDRAARGVTDQTTQQSHEGESVEVDPFDFPEGGLLRKSNNTIKEGYAKIIERAISLPAQFFGEPVPRFSKRSSDLTLQGSNNTLITLGNDRTGDVDSTGEDLTDATGFAGTIDIVAGRGGPSLDGEDVIWGTDTASPAATATNARGNIEVDKAPTISETDADADNPNEGDPDFENDMSRVYVSMKTNGDANFGISELEGLGSDNETELADREEESFVVMKSTNTRIVSKGDGSVKIVKMANPDVADSKEAHIVIDASGNIQIRTDGRLEFCGNGSQADEDNAKGVADQPYLRWEQWMAYMDATLDAIIGDMDNIAADIGNIQSALKSSATPGYGGPDAACMAAGNIPSTYDALKSLGTTLQKPGDTTEPANDIKSDVIFGE